MPPGPPGPSDPHPSPPPTAAEAAQTPRAPGHEAQACSGDAGRSTRWIPGASHPHALRQRGPSPSSPSSSSEDGTEDRMDEGNRKGEAGKAADRTDPREQRARTQAPQEEADVGSEAPRGQQSPRCAAHARGRAFADTGPALLHIWVAGLHRRPNAVSNQSNDFLCHIHTKTLTYGKVWIFSVFKNEKFPVLTARTVRPLKGRLHLASRCEERGTHQLLLLPSNGQPVAMGTRLSSQHQRGGDSFILPTGS